MTKALVVLSGGQDSTTCLFWAVDKLGANNVHAVCFDYGQRHRIELKSAEKVAQMSGCASFEIINLAEGTLQSTSPLTSDNELDKYSDFASMEKQVGRKIEKTFVPMRNSLFFIIAANRAVALNCNIIVTGICQQDNANYPDCTEIFRTYIQCAINASLGLNEGDLRYISIVAPLMYKSKAQTVELASRIPGCWDALAYTHTSYDGKYPPTDNNHSNLLRAEGFLQAGLPDPLVVRAWREGLMELPNTANYKDLIK